MANASWHFQAWTGGAAYSGVLFDARPDLSYVEFKVYGRHPEVPKLQHCSRFGLGVSGLAESLVKFGLAKDPSDSRSREALCCFFERTGPSCSVIQPAQSHIGVLLFILSQRCQVDQVVVSSALQIGRSLPFTFARRNNNRSETRKYVAHTD